MELRNIQRSGTTYYVYLPAQWCKNNKIDPKSKLLLDTSPEGKLMITPFENKKDEQTLEITMPDSEPTFINNYIKAAFLNPVKSFKIKLNKEIDSNDILLYKEHMGGIEFVEFGKNQVTCEAPIFTKEPDVLLSIMIRKVLSMIDLIKETHNKDLIDRYEEEIDRSNISIRKAAMSTLMFKRTSNLKHIELFYIVEISSELEKIADHIVSDNLNKKELEKTTELIKTIQKTMKELDIDSCKSFFDLTNKNKIKIIHNHLSSISDIFIDWSITKMIL